MTILKRRTLILGGGTLATLPFARPLRALATEVVEMRGTARGERVWFAPQGLAVTPGTTVRFVNRDPGNSHTSTAYHPDIFERHRRIPKASTPWDSGFLLPDAAFEVTLTVPGVYDYYCIPHEMAAMVGRIVVGTRADPGWEGPDPDTGDVTPDILAAFPAVEDILSRGRVEQEDGA